MYCSGRHLAGPGFDSRSIFCHITSLGKIVRAHVLPSPTSIIWYSPKGDDVLKLGLADSNVSLTSSVFRRLYMTVQRPGPAAAPTVFTISHKLSVYAHAAINL